jgi:hypothetical protein
VLRCVETVPCLMQQSADWRQLVLVLLLLLLLLLLELLLF